MGEKTQTKQPVERQQTRWICCNRGKCERWETRKDKEEGTLHS